MGFTQSTNTYAGGVYEDFITTTVQSNQTFDRGLIRIIAGIQDKFVLPTASIGNVFQDRAATPTSSVGNITLSERYLEPNDFMVYTEFNPRNFENYWEFAQPQGILIFRTLDPAVQALMLRLITERAAQQMGEMIWKSTKGGGTTGITTPSGQEALGNASAGQKYFDGYIKRLVLSAADDPDGHKVISAGTTALDTGAKVEAALYTMYEMCPKEIRDSRLRFVMEQDTFDLYDKYLSDKTNKYTENDTVNNRRFKGIDIVPLVGITNQTIVLGEFGTSPSSNFWMGVDTLRDFDAMQVDKLQNNSELYFVKMLMKVDVNFARPSEIVIHTPWTKA